MDSRHQAAHELPRQRLPHLGLSPQQQLQQLHQQQLHQQQLRQQQLQQQLHQQQRPQQQRRRHHPLRALLGGLFQALVTALALVGLVALATAGWVLSAEGLALPSLRPAQQQLVRAAESLGLPEQIVAPVAPRRQVVYLNREGGLLTAGPDDATHNVSSVIAGAKLESFEVPAFQGTAARWEAIRSCVQGQFSAYDIAIVDQRPTAGPYIMVMLGGSPGELPERTGNAPAARTRVTGLAPLGRTAIDDAVVFVFARDLREQTRPVCETVTHEIGHALGLDHVLDCHDPMTHLASCGQRTFQDRDTTCGEHGERACVDGEVTQNSHQQLLEVLGARPASANAPQRQVSGGQPSSRTSAPIASRS